MLPDVDRVGQHSQQVGALLAVPPAAAPRVVQVVQVAQEGETVSLLEVSNDSTSLLVSLHPGVEIWCAGWGLIPDKC